MTQRCFHVGQLSDQRFGLVASRRIILKKKKFGNENALRVNRKWLRKKSEIREDRILIKIYILYSLQIFVTSILFPADLLALVPYLIENFYQEMTLRENWRQGRLVGFRLD